MWGGLFITTAVLGSLTALFNVFGANLYDIKQAQMQRQKKLQPNARRYRRRPLLSLIILTHNSESSITACLNSLFKNNYRKLEVVVVDQASQDSTSQLVRAFIKQHPKQKIRLCTQRRLQTHKQSFSYALKKYVKGDLVMLQERPVIVDSKAFSKMVDHFNVINPDVLTLNHKIAHSYTTTGLFQEFWLLLRGRTRKAANHLNSAYTLACETAFVGTVPAITQWLRGRRLNELKVRYASNVVTYSQAFGFSSFAASYYREQIKRLTAYRGIQPAERRISQALPMLASLMGTTLSLMTPVVLTYFSYMALRLHQPDFLIISWAMLALYLLFAIWEDEQLKLRQKVKYVLLIPVTYIWFYLVSLVEFAVVLTSFRALRLRRA